jgi:hypothetical protein
MIFSESTDQIHGRFVVGIVPQIKAATQYTTLGATVLGWGAGRGPRPTGGLPRC